MNSPSVRSFALDHTLQITPHLHTDVLAAFHADYTASSTERRVSHCRAGLDQINTDVASMTADGAYERPVASETTAAQSDTHLTTFGKHGRMSWAAKRGLSSQEIGGDGDVVQDRHQSATARPDAIQINGPRRKLEAVCSTG
jgi:hypothetical protein